MNILILPGDGIGPEVTAQAAGVLKAVLGGAATFEEAPVGGAGVKAAGVPLPPATFELAKRADAILFGAAGLPGDELGPRHLRPGGALLTLRRELKLYANFRPAVLYPELVGASSLKPELVEGLDLMVLRELNGDIYYGTPRGIRSEDGVRVGVNTMRYTEPEIERIAHAGFKAARGRRKKLCSVDKANVLETMVLWRETVAKVATQYPDVELR
ncbi:MAG TPA: isocitrate/isopropylmalate family dehydrogenase, partial [Burkholderiales bacterium]|nr:isocitrate/isopropylmalate family dehydrogenase [Burkholderiales bacterium]